MNRSADLSPAGPPAKPALPWYWPAGLWQRRTTVIAALALAGIALHLGLRFGLRACPDISIP